LRINEIGQTAYITFSGQYDFEEIKFTQCAFAEPSAETLDGNVYKQKLEIVLAGDDLDLSELLIDYQKSKPIIKIEYDNGDLKLMGNKQNYCNMTINNDSENFETKTVLSFTREDYKPAPFILV